MGADPQSPALLVDRGIGRAVESPLVRGGLTIGAGLVLGNLIGFVRVAITAYLLGTHNSADALAVSVSPLDTLNSVLINTMVFAFVPMLTERRGAERTALFLKLNRLFSWVFTVVTFGVIGFAPALIRILAPGLRAEDSATAVSLLRIIALSSMAAGAAAIHSALLFTEGRFGPTVFYQASLNLFTIIGAVGLWRFLGVYGFAVGYTIGAWVQLAVVYFAARSGLDLKNVPRCSTPWRELLAKPGSFLTYAGMIALNVIITRAYATHAGPGMAAALDYCMRCINVPLAYLINPISNSLLPEIARLRSHLKVRQAFRLIDKTIGLVALIAVAGCAVGILVCRPVIALLFQRGNFTAHSTELVAAVFLGFAPSLIGWSLLELTSRSLFALDRPWLPVAASVIPVLFNAGYVALAPREPQFIGLGASIGLLVAFVVLFLLARASRKREPAAV